MSKLLCIYHGFCDDGFAAAWAVRHALGDENVEFYPGVYQQPPPDVTGRAVLFVDFSYKRPVIEEIAAKAATLLILDHHKTADEDLRDLPKVPHHYANYLKAGIRVGVLFDMTRSGAGIAWDFFHNAAARPRFIDYVEDRDLWRKKLPGGDEFTIALRSYPQDFEVWDKMRLTESSAVGALIHEGASIQRYYRMRVEELKGAAYQATINWDGGIAGNIASPILIANAPYFAASEVAGELAEIGGVDFGASYFEVEVGRWQYSLRSRGDFDVSTVARCYGGGGHKNAAGFNVDRPVHTKA